MDNQKNNIKRRPSMKLNIKSKEIFIKYHKYDMNNSNINNSNPKYYQPPLINLADYKD